MKEADNIQLASFINTTNPKVVISEVRTLFSVHYPKKYFNAINRSYRNIKKLFEGKFPGYKACNTEYHNLNHTLDAFLATSRLIYGYNLEEEKKMPLDLTIDLLISSMFHDTGYIQEEWDNAGTGAKYTKTHIGRSIAFLVKEERKFNITQENIAIISRLIRCTGLNTNLNDIPFISNEERIAGSILGTADILGQMSDRIYLEKLLFLYYEFREAGIQGFNTEFDIIRNTIDFYEQTKKRLDKSFMKKYDYARYYFKDRFNIDQNLYMKAISNNIAYIYKIIDDNSTNFRHKLKRGDWINKSYELSNRVEL